MLDRKTLALATSMLALVGGRAFAAEGADAGAAEVGAGDAGVPDGAATGDGGAAPSEGEQAVSGGAGLFEQSTTATAAGSSVHASAAPRLNLSGYLRGDLYAGKIPAVGASELKAGYGELALQARTTKESWGDGFAELRVRHGLQGDQQQTFVDLREAYVNTYLGPIDLRLGKQIIVWGRADLLNPTNNLTPNDLRIRSPIEDDRRVGNVGARMNLRLSPVRVEAVWLPTYVATELPQVSMPQFVSFGAPVNPSANLKNGLAAGRVHLELPSIELSASYLRGYAPMPGLTLTGLTFDLKNPSVLISRTAYQHQVVGFDFSTAFGNVLALRGEAAYRRPVDYQNTPNAPRPDLQYALGADRAFGPVSVIVQYLGRTTFDWKKENGPAMKLDPGVLQMDPVEGESFRDAYSKNINSHLARMNQILFSQTAKVQHLASARVEWLTLHDTLSLSAVGMVNVTTQEWMVAPKLGYRLSDALIAYLGAEVLTGPGGTLFGLVDQRMSAGYAELRSTF